MNDVLINLCSYIINIFFKDVQYALLDILLYISLKPCLKRTVSYTYKV